MAWHCSAIEVGFLRDENSYDENCTWKYQLDSRLENMSNHNHQVPDSGYQTKHEIFNDAHVLYFCTSDNYSKAWERINRPFCISHGLIILHNLPNILAHKSTLWNRFCSSNSPTLKNSKTLQYDLWSMFNNNSKGLSRVQGNQSQVASISPYCQFWRVPI